MKLAMMMMKVMLPTAVMTAGDDSLLEVALKAENPLSPHDLLHNIISSCSQTTIGGGGGVVMVVVVGYHRYK